jgi:hypothetical protein
MAMAALLKPSTVVRMAPFQFSEHRQRLGYALQIAQAHGDHVEHIAVLGNLRAQRLGRRQRGTELAAPQEFAYATHLGFDLRWGSALGGGLHVYLGKGRVL